MGRGLIPKKGQSALRRAVDDVSRQMTKVRTSTDEESGIATVSGEMYGKRMSYTIRQSELGEIRTASAYEDLPRKSDYKEEVQQLYREGYKQREIALMLGISQSLVSKLINS